MRRIKLWHISVALLLGALGLIGFLGATSRLGWAWNALGAYGSGSTTGTLEHTLERQAIAILQRDGDIAKARALLEQSLSIDPNSSAIHALGEVYLREGNLPAARQQYEHYLTVDPAFLPSYLRLLEIYDRLELTDERTRLLESGVAYFEANLDAFVPRPDDEAFPIFNDKAYGVHHSYRESLEILRRRLGEQ